MHPASQETPPSRRTRQLARAPRGTAALATLAIAAIAAIALLPAPALAQALRVEGLRTEYATNPIGIDERAPRLSWRLVAARRGTMQRAYEIRVAPDSATLSRAPLWSSGRVSSDASLFVPYGGPAPRSGQRYWWQVRVWDDAGAASPWSAPAYWEMGLLGPTDWKARWIAPDLDEDTTRANPAPLLRREFTLAGGRIASARLYVTSLGLNDVAIDGQRVGDRLFVPGWTSYDTRLQYVTYDVSPLVHAGRNAIGVTLGDGWYRGHFGFAGRRNNYGTTLGLRAQLVVRYVDGKADTIATDTRWRAATGPIVSSDIYDGESYDARLERAGWTRPGYDDSAWRTVRTFERPGTALIAPEGPPVRRIQELRAVKILHTPAGETVFDLGQNMVGWVRLRVRGARGDTVTLRFAEVLDSAGNLYTANLRGARATDSYVLKGGGDERFEPHFTFHGFRYVAVAGYPGTPPLDAITGIVIHSDMASTGSFATSNPLLNQLQHNIQWGQYGNFLDVPTDCPQRDERMGWTGDAEVFAPTAAFNMDVSGFMAKWLGDVAADQHRDGSVPDVIPDVLTRGRPTGGAASGWADAAVIVPWTMYQAYGDTRLLARQYPSMRAWVDYEHAQAGDSLLWKSGHHYGDWLAYATSDADYPGATTAKDLLATAYFAHSADLLARAAAVLGKADDARRYGALVERIRQAFAREYVTATGRLSSDTQTAYAIALSFGLVPDSLRATAARRLGLDVRRMGHLTTGFLGTPVLTRTLSDAGYLDDAYALLLNERYPSWLYPVTRGATTIWERWDGLRPDGTFEDPSMNSFNHYAYGAIGDWMYRVVAGLDMDPSQPAYRHALIQPHPGGGLTSARATLATPYGELASGWIIADGRMELSVRVPPNTTASVRLPRATLPSVTEGGTPVAGAAGVVRATQDGDVVVVEVGSGDYRFLYPFAGAPESSGTGNSP